MNSITTCTGDDLVYKLFALSRLFEKEGNFDTAYLYLSQGNQLKSQRCQFDHVAFRDSLLRQRAYLNLACQTSTSSRVPIFIVGMPRSGSTLLEQMLSNHSAIQGCGELTTLSELATTSALDKHIGDRYLSRVSGMLSMHYFIDKMPGNFAYLALIKRQLPQANLFT